MRFLRNIEIAASKGYLDLTEKQIDFDQLFHRKKSLWEKSVENSEEKKKSLLQARW